MGIFQPGPTCKRVELANEAEFHLGGMTIRPAERLVVFDNQRRELQPRVMQVFVALAKARPDVVSRDQLLDLCWKGRIVSDDALNRCVLALRHLAQEFAPQPFAIETVPRIGHRLVELPAGTAGRERSLGDRRWARPLVAVGTIVAVSISAAILLGRSGQWLGTPANPTPTVLVMSAARDAVSQELVRDLAVKLGGLQQPGPSVTIRLIGMTANKSEDPDLVLQVAASADQPSAGASAVLSVGPSRAVLWSNEFVQPSNSIADLKQQVAVRTAHVLRCTAEGMASEQPLSEDNLRTYVTACAALADSMDDYRGTIGSLEALVQSSPSFVYGWGLLVRAELLAVTDPRTDQGKERIDALRQHIRLARKLRPHLADAYAAQAALLPEYDFLAKERVLNTAVEHNPEHAVLRHQRAMFLQSMGRIHDALVDAHEAVRIDPLSPATREAQILTLAIAGRRAAARQELDAVERLWPDAESTRAIRLLFLLRWGDPREALRIHLSEQSPRRTARVLEPLLRARINPTSANVEQALRHGRMVLRERPGSISLYSQLLAEFDRNDELYELLLNWQRPDMTASITDVLFRPAFADFHREARFMRVAEHLGLLSYWRATGEWPDFCYAPDLPYDCRVEAERLNRLGKNVKS